MGQPYVGEIRIFAGNFAPSGWMLCQGQLLPISQNETLFNLIGTTYGGDGQSTFALPNLQSRVPIHQGTFSGSTFTMGQSGGTESVTLNTQQIPAHNHFLLATGGNPSLSPANAAPADASSISQPGVNTYGPSSGSPTTLNPATIQVTGGNQPHDNMQPWLGLNFIISMFGVFPSQT
jgi:microcystin-dependent protein